MIDLTLYPKTMAALESEEDFSKDLLMSESRHIVNRVRKRLGLPEALGTDYVASTLSEIEDLL